MQKEMGKRAEFIAAESHASSQLQASLKSEQFSVKGILQDMDGFAWLKF